MSTERSEAQKAASRANGAKSNGPTTEAGKEASSKNATKHGAYSRIDVGLYESSDEFQERLAGYREALLPANRVEDDLVYDLASAKHQLERFTAMITALFDHGVETYETEITTGWKHFDAHTLRTLALTRLGQEGLRTFEALSRAQARARRLYSAAKKDLLDLQDRRRKETEKAGKNAREAAKPEPIHLPADVLQFEPDDLTHGLSVSYLRSVLEGDHYRPAPANFPKPAQPQPDKEAA